MNRLISCIISSQPQINREASLAISTAGSAILHPAATKLVPNSLIFVEYFSQPALIQLIWLSCRDVICKLVAKPIKSVLRILHENPSISPCKEGFQRIHSGHHGYERERYTGPGVESLQAENDSGRHR